jgi:alkylated DNA repair dioxygenase AlkB
MTTTKVQNGEIIYADLFLDKLKADALFEDFISSLPFHQGTIKLFGKTHSIPRLEAFFASEKRIYSYSGVDLQTHDFTKELLVLKEQIEKICGEKFNCVLVNLYRNGQDSNGWHADDELALGKNPIIASLSLGATRRFDLKHNLTKEKISYDLTSGSLLVMKGAIQHYWKHQIAKNKKVNDPRINLTFRYIY